MIQYIKRFKTHTEYQTYITGQDAILPNVSYCEDQIEVHYNPYTYAEEYLTFVALEDGAFSFIMDEKLTTSAVPSMSYSIDNGETWITVSNVNGEEVTITTPTITTGNKVLWKSNAVQYCINSDPYPGSNVGYGKFSSTNNFNIQGNIMSLIYEDNFKGQTTFKSYISNGYGAGAFSGLFQNTKIISAEHLELPATTLASSCYMDIFNSCTLLTTAPELRATTLANHCYAAMFKGCSSLTTTPELPVTTLSDNCYRSMFNGCTSLTTAPELPATTLVEGCYYSMFNGCTSLTTSPELPATILATYCYGAMFKGCTSLVIAPELPATTLNSYCYSIMFEDCTALTTAPELPATTLADNCYLGMFSGCTSLTTAPELSATTLANSCYNTMFGGCTSLTTAPELPATILTSSCYQCMFEDCTSLTTAPELPAIVLVSGCYNSIFDGCTSLNYIKVMFTTTPSSLYTSYWVRNVASTGTFVKNNAASWNVTGVNGVPSGWTVQTVDS